MQTYELRLLDALQALHTPLLDALMVFITHLGDYGLLWILLSLLMIFFPKTRKTGVLLAVALLLDLLMSNLFLKPFVARLRPFTLRPNIPLLVPRPLDYSFPSGHTAASFTASVTILGQKNRLGWPALVLSFLIGFSRLYLYVHYPTDVLAGILIGCCIGGGVTVFSKSLHSIKLRQVFRFH